MVENMKNTSNKKLLFDGRNDKYKMLDKAIVEIISSGKTSSKIKILSLDDTDLYRPKTNSITSEQMKKSADKTFLNKTFTVKNIFIKSI